MAGLDEFLGQVVADLAAADDEDEHGQASWPARPAAVGGAPARRSRSDGVGVPAVVVLARRGWLPVGGEDPAAGPTAGKPR